MKKIIFLGSKAIGSYCLRQLIEHPRAEVIAVLTNDRRLDDRGETVSQIAANGDIPVLNSPEEIPETDFLISVQYHKLLKNKHLKKAKVAAVNLHMAPLPEYRGCNQFSFAVADKRTTFGTTLHIMNEGIDSGPVLFEKRFPVDEHITVKELYELTAERSKQLFSERLSDLLNERYQPIPQEELIPERGTSTHYRNEIEILKQIDLNRPEDEIDRRIRATFFPPFPPPFAVVNGKKIHLDLNWKTKLKKMGLYPAGN